MPNKIMALENIQVLEGLDAVRKRPGCILVVRLLVVCITSYTKL